MAALNPTPFSSTNGNSASGTSVTVTLPTYAVGDFLLLIGNSNNAPSVTFGANVTATQLVTAGSRITAWKIVPIDGAQASFAMTLGASSVYEWWVGNYRGADLAATIYSANNAQGNSTSSTLTLPVATLGYIATGNEVAVAAGGVNSTATWTTDANTIFHTTANNAALQVEAKNPTAGDLTAAFAAIDRGNTGSSRNQNAITVVLQPTANNAVPNLLTNPSFEQGTTIASSWQDEHTTAATATYTVTSTGASDGATAQRIQYTGQAGDTGSGILEIFQAPITGMAPGDVLTFTLKMSGSWANVYAIVGIEAFTAGNAYISETDTSVLSVTGTPTDYSVTYTCPPGTDHVAAYVQWPGIAPSTTIDVTLDKARLTKSTTLAVPVSAGFFGA